MCRFVDRAITVDVISHPLCSLFVVALPSWLDRAAVKWKTRYKWEREIVGCQGDGGDIYTVRLTGRFRSMQQDIRRGGWRSNNSRSSVVAVVLFPIFFFLSPPFGFRLLILLALLKQFTAVDALRRRTLLSLAQDLDLLDSFLLRLSHPFLFNWFSNFLAWAHSYLHPRSPMSSNEAK